eukprot:sb/3466998/
MSIFLIFTFNVVRTRTLLFPFAKRSKGVVQAVIGCYLAFAIVQVFLPYFFNSSYDFSQDYLVCLWDFGAVFGKDSRQYFLLYGLFNVAERIVPFICVILSCCISYILLTRSELIDDKPSPGGRFWMKGGLAKSTLDPRDKQKNRATLTIILTTGFYCLANLPNLTFTILSFSDLILYRSSGALLSFDRHNYFAVFSMVVCAGVHATGTPIICILRMEGLRAFYRALIARAGESVGISYPSTYNRSRGSLTGSLGRRRSSANNTTPPKGCLGRALARLMKPLDSRPNTEVSTANSVGIHLPPSLGATLKPPTPLT